MPNAGAAAALLLVAAASCAAAAGAAKLAGPAPCNCTGRAGVGNWATALSHRKLATSAACCAACNANAECVMWEHGDGTCWLKSNGGELVAKPDRVSGSCGSAPPGPLPPPAPPPPPPPPSTLELTLQLRSNVIATTSSAFVSYCLDWWAPTQGARPEGWGTHANVLELDFTSPRLQALVGALGPSYLRIGGSLDKDVVYNLPGTTEPCPTHSGRGPVTQVSAQSVPTTTNNFQGVFLRDCWWTCAFCI